MKKAGIITFHSADNYGAVLQAYALTQTIKNLGIEVQIIDFSPKVITNPYTLFFSLKLSIIDSGFINTIKSVLSRVKNIIKIIIRIKNFNAFRLEHLSISNERYKSSDDLNKKSPFYDFYITGSDQVWNPDFFSKIGFSYFLDFALDEAVKIAYAPSISNEHANLFNEVYKKQIKKFDYLSVREPSDKDFVSQFTDKQVSVTIDPSMLMQKEQWKEIATYNLAKEKYVLVYNLVNSPLITQVANKIANALGCKIITFLKKPGYDNYIGCFGYCNPTDFVGLFEKAEFVVTSSFHGTAFSLIFNKQFCTIPHPTRGGRMVDLLSALDLQNRLVRDYDKTDEMFDIIDYNTVNNKLSVMRESSIDFLKEALGVN